jgi:DnaJ-class molecular chaperone
MKRIKEYRKMFNADETTDLGQLKIAYRNLMKEWHPDKFPEGHPQFDEAEVKSKTIIEAYHFLVGISPETHKLNAEDYAQTTNTSAIDHYTYEGQVLNITFQDGSAYEYLGVPKNIYGKFVNTATQTRFARRHIFNTYTYRNISKMAVMS